MKNFIEELYYGNLEPQARAIKPNTKVKRQVNILTDLETKRNTAQVNDVAVEYISNIPKKLRI